MCAIFYSSYCELFESQILISSLQMYLKIIALDPDTEMRRHNSSANRSTWNKLISSNNSHRTHAMVKVAISDGQITDDQNRSEQNFKYEVLRQ